MTFGGRQCLPLLPVRTAKAWKAQLFLGGRCECPAWAKTNLAFQRHVVDLGVQQHGAGAERHSLICDGPRCPAVNPQDLLFAGDDQLFPLDAVLQAQLPPHGLLLLEQLLQGLCQGGRGCDLQSQRGRGGVSGG